MGIFFLVIIIFLLIGLLLKEKINTIGKLFLIIAGFVTIMFFSYNNIAKEVKNNIIANKTGNAYDDIKMVHDYLVNNVEYDTSISQSNIYDIYGALVNNVAVCEGYARAFKYIMDEMNIPCVLVIGQGKNSQGQTENHAWNYVELNNKWYAIDVTWDDPVVTGGGGASKESRYKYFLKGSNTFLQDHVPSGQFTPNGKVFEYPDISKEDL